jgi:hypothetical protein
MLILRFYHDENRLFVGRTEYRATCPVRNELNGERGADQIVKTYPITSSLGRLPYQPRKFPTGLWLVKRPIWTEDIEYAPVKIPTDAIRCVLTWSVGDGKYKEAVSHQDDSYYHLHYSSTSRTTLGCIRLDSAEDAIEIAREVLKYQKAGEEVWLEVIASRACER